MTVISISTREETQSNKEEICHLHLQEKGKKLLLPKKKTPSVPAEEKAVEDPQAKPKAARASLNKKKEEEARKAAEGNAHEQCKIFSSHSTCPLQKEPLL